MLQAVGEDVKDESPEADVSEVFSPVSPPAISLLSPKAMETAGRIIRFEQEQREKAKVKLRGSSLVQLFCCQINSEMCSGSNFQCSG